MAVLLRGTRLLWAIVPALILCALFAGLRYDIDNDYWSYLYLFEDIPPLTAGLDKYIAAAQETYLEPGFSLFISTLKIFLNDTSLFLPIAFISLSLYLWIFTRTCRYPAAAFLIYIADGFYLREFTQVRFGLAVALGLAALTALWQGKTNRYYLLGLLAFFFHYTAIFLFLSRAWTRHVATRKRIVVVATVLLALALSGTFANVVDHLAAAGLAPARLLIYVDTDDAASVSPALIILQYGIVLLAAVNIREQSHNYFFVSIYALSFAFLCVFSGFDLMRRVSFLFTPALYILASVSLQQRKRFLFLMILALSVITLNARFSILNPYQSLLS